MPLIERLRGLAGWRGMAVLFAAGAFAALAQAPFNQLWVLFISFPVLCLALERVRGWAAFWRGWWFALGYFSAGLCWIAAALFVDIAQFWWALPLAVLGLPIVLAIFVGLALAAFSLFGAQGWRRVLLFAAAWAAAEWVRGHIFTGFPWLLVGYAWVETPALQLAAVGGAFALSFWAVLVASWPVLFPRYRLLFVLLLLLPLGFGWWRVPEVATGGQLLRIVQPNIEQTLKMSATSREEILRRLLAQTATPAEGTIAAVIWPETAVPYILGNNPELREQIGAALPTGAVLLTGALRTEEGRYYNSLEALDGQGRILGHYDKAHLVPFGEYIPFREWLPFNPIASMADFSEGPGPQTLALAGLPPFSPLICYEVIFPGAVVDAANRPSWLLNVTNDGWYGRSHGPYQHFAMSQVRAVEEGLPMVRAANTGVSGVADAYGRIMQSLPLGAAGVVDVALPPPLPPTLYAVYGDILFFALLFMALLPQLARRLSR